MIRYFCDRCGKECYPYGEKEGKFGTLNQSDYEIKKIGDWRDKDIELCPECTEFFINWLENNE